jgi:hypothetical protein
VEYFGNSILAASTGDVLASELLARGHGWAAAAVGCAVVAHTDAFIRSRVAAGPSVAAFRMADANGMFVSSSPRFNMYGCDFGWGKPVAARSGKANKYDGKVSLFPGREGGGGIDTEVELSSRRRTWRPWSRTPSSGPLYHRTRLTQSKTKFYLRLYMYFLALEYAFCLVVVLNLLL